MSSDAIAVVLAAGKGTRMKSDLPKVLIPVLGRPMIEYVVGTLREAGIGRVIAVVGYRGDDVRRQLAGWPGVEFAEQTEQRGTGHAVMMGRELLAGHNGPVVVVTGDSPMLQASSVRGLLEEFQSRPTACLLGTLHKDNPTGLGRIVRGAAGEFLGIVEQRDASEEERKITEVNMSTYVFNGPDLLWALDQLTNNNDQGEYYITDTPAILRAAGKYVNALPILQPCEALSINTAEELQAVERAIGAQ